MKATRLLGNALSVVLLFCVGLVIFGACRTLATVPSSTSRVQYAGNGATTAFAVTFPYIAKSEIVVTEISSGGQATVKTLTTHYTLTAPNGVSGTVTMLTAPATGTTLRIERTAPFTQTTNFRAQGSFVAGVHENALDRLTYQTQQLHRRVADLEDGGSFQATTVTANYLVLHDGGVLTFGDGSTMSSASIIGWPFQYPCASSTNRMMRTGLQMQSRSKPNTTDYGGYGAQFSANTGIVGPTFVMQTTGETGCTTPVAQVQTPNNLNPSQWISLHQLDMTQYWNSFWGMRSDTEVSGARRWAVIDRNMTTWYNADTIGDTDGIGFRFSFPAGDTSWQGCSRGTATGATQSCCSTGVPYTANTYYGLWLRVWNNGGTRTATFTVRAGDGTTGSCSKTANLPSANYGYMSYAGGSSDSSPRWFIFAGGALDQ